MLAPLEHLATRQLMPTAISPPHLWLGVLLLMAGSGLAFSRGWLWAGLALFLLSTPLSGIGERLARLRMRGGRPDGWLVKVRPLVAGAALIALSYALYLVDGWGNLALGASAIGFSAALAGEGRRSQMAGGIMLAEPKGMAWLMLPFAIAGQWTAGLAAIGLYAAGILFLGPAPGSPGRPGKGH